MQGGAPDVAHHSRVDGPGIGPVGRAAEVAKRSPGVASRYKISRLRHGSEGTHGSPCQTVGQSGKEKPKAMKRPGDSILNSPEVHKPKSYLQPVAWVEAANSGR